VLLKKYSRENKAILLRLNNKMIQVVFLDKSELILSSDSGNVDFITSKEEVRSTQISNDMKCYSSLEKSDPSMHKRLNYAKEMLLNLINPKMGKNNPKQNLVLNKNFSSETKENKLGFSRKNSESTSAGLIDFYSTQPLNSKERSPVSKYNDNGKF
jgi:hypothetical protein